MINEFLRISYVLNNQQWVFASTMMKFPHRYIHRDNWKLINNYSFDNAVETIRSLGVEERFYKTTYIYLHINGLKFWTMGAPISETTIINVAATSHDNEYSCVANNYDDYFSDNSSIHEDSLLSAELNKLKGTSWIDIGCGTGLGARLCPSYVSSYLGIDPSASMLARFKLSKCFSDLRLINDYAENVYLDFFADTVISLYGSISYLEPACIERIKDFISRKGTIFLMAYKDDYVPVIHKRMNRAPKIKTNNKQLINLFPNCDVTDFGLNNQYLTLSFKKK